MIFNIEKETDFSFDFDLGKVYEDAVNNVLDYFDCPYDCEISLLLVDNEAIREINADTRGIDNPTDVLSFPNAVFNEPGDFDSIDESDDIFEPDSGELILGDIVLSGEKVLQQADEYGHSVLREYSFLITHSMLHLLGFDHIEEDDRLIMEKYQEELMNKLGISR